MKPRLLKTVETAKKIVSYFDGQIIGSYLIRLIIDQDLINDIDVSIDASLYFNVQEFLNDEGYVETKAGYKQNGYEDTIGSCLFKKSNQVPIHLCLSKGKVSVYSIPELLAAKIKRYNKQDQKQLLFILQNNSSPAWKNQQN